MIVGILIIVVALSGVCLAGEADQDGLMYKWRDEHNQQVVRLIRYYLTGEPASVQQKAIKEIFRLEALLATCSTREKDFVLGGFKVDSLTQIPGQILVTHLKYKGIRLNAKKFFENKQFQYFVSAY